MSVENILPASLMEEFIRLSSEKSHDINEKIALWGKIISVYTTNTPLGDLYKMWMYLFKDEAIPVAWMPGKKEIKTSNVGRLMHELGMTTYNEIHQWSVSDRHAFWKKAMELTGICFEKPYTHILNTDHGVEDPIWLEGALMNITDSCFNASPEAIALIQGSEDTDQLKKLTYRELQILVNRVASGLIRSGFKPGDRLLIYMPFTIEAIAAYLAIVKAGMVVVSVADSFSSSELKRRIEKTQVKAVFTCDGYWYGGKELSVISKALEADAPSLIVCNYLGKAVLRTERNDQLWEDFLNEDSFTSFKTTPDAYSNILFSSGTTKEPKFIPWTHLTPIKCATDGYFHQNIQEGDIVTWTTGMGWMMGPWLIYASLINKSTMAIYTGAATTEKFGRFMEKANVNILGTIPSVVKAWVNQDFIHKYEWNIKVFSSTGEPSNAEDYFYLMALGKFRAPIIEYCGGTEIGGGYITGTVVQPASPATFTTPALGISFYLLNENHQPVKSGEPGEVFIIPPSIGLTQKLLNRDHHAEYYQETPVGPRGEVLRKHGDAFEFFPSLNTCFYKSVGRMDDAMNLGGIKISAVEIEQALNNHTSILETAAISIPGKEGGPEKLVVYYVPKRIISDLDTLKKELQQILTRELNPLFRISEIRLMKSLPRTSSNKLMRRELRKDYMATYS